MKLSGAAGVTVVLMVSAVLLFRGQTIRWLPLAAPVMALVVTTVSAFAWSYLKRGPDPATALPRLSQSLSPEMADEVLRDPGLMSHLGGQRREMTVMFTDIAGFTEMSETMDVEKLTELLNYYLEEMSAVVLAGRAYARQVHRRRDHELLERHPLPQPDHAALACRAALDMQRKEREIQPELRRRGAERFMTRIGINTGPMAVGNIGSSRKFNYTVLGDSVNLGSRLEGANKLYGSGVCMAQTTADLVKDRFLLRQLDFLKVKGRRKPMAVYELLGEGFDDADLRSRAERYETALRCYTQQKWDDAEAHLRGLLADFPDDAPAAALLARVAQLREDPPRADWDGVYVAKDK